MRAAFGLSGPRHGRRRPRFLATDTFTMMSVDPLLTPAASKVDETGVLITDIACRRCSYNLRGLREDGRCPECGIRVGLSTRGDLLRFADPTWVETVARGLKIILWMILVGFIAGAAAAALSATGNRAAAIPASLVAAIGSFYGVWLMTEPDPSGIGEDPNVTARKVVRFTLVLGLVAQFITMTLVLQR